MRVISLSVWLAIVLTFYIAQLFTLRNDPCYTISINRRLVMKKPTKMQKKIGKVMGEFKSGTLHSGKGGPVVKSRKQAVAIAMSEGRKASKKK